MPLLARALLSPNSELPGRPPWSLRQTHLASDAIQLSLSMRWAILILSLMLTLLSTRGWPGLGISFLVAIGYTAALTLSARIGRLPSPWLTAIIDVALVTSAVFFRGGLVSDIYLLYTLVLIYMGLAYAWNGVAAALALIFATYLPMLAIAHGLLGEPLNTLGGSSISLRLAYLTLVGVGIGYVVTHYERAHQALAQTQDELADRVRRLEAIQRISQRLHALTSIEAIGEAIAAETRDLIPYTNCRVHLWREGPDGVTLPLIGFYGALANEEAPAAGTLDVRLGEGVTGWVAEHGTAVLINDATSDPRARHIPGTPRLAYSLLAVPLHIESRVKGVITMGRPGSGQFSADDRQLLEILANSAAVALENAATQEVLEQQARTDPVTGLAHHGSFQIALAIALAEARPAQAPVALALLDLDGFRNYNERLGVQAGDACLERVGRFLNALAADLGRVGAVAGAPPATAYRIGGDEFALVLQGPLAQETAAVGVAQRAVHGIAALFGDDPLARITASAGLAFYPGDAPTRQALVALADAVVYLVRQTGGNRLGRADALAHETLVLRRNLDTLVQTSLADSGSETVVEYLVTETSALQRSLHHSSLADRLTTEALRALAAAIDAKDDYTRGHSERVAASAAEIARFMECGSQEVNRIATAARMHDIGKIGVPDELLHKGHGLTPAERDQVARHPEVGAAILLPIHTLRDVVPIVRHHHEHVDGTGYPAGLQGEDIPFGARILAVADALDAMITDRPYRKGMAISMALAELQRHAGTHFWPPVVAAAMALYGPGGSGLALHGVLRAELPEVPATPHRTGPRPDESPARPVRITVAAGPH